MPVAGPSTTLKTQIIVRPKEKSLFPVSIIVKACPLLPFFLQNLDFVGLPELVTIVAKLFNNFQT